jgi:hypothetical protein
MEQAKPIYEYTALNFQIVDTDLPASVGTLPTVATATCRRTSKHHSAIPSSLQSVTAKSGKG